VSAGGAGAAPHPLPPIKHRIHILEKRLKRHEEQALQKYYELDHRLRNDTRLSALLTI
jgi:hypothetical protein